MQNEKLQASYQLDGSIRMPIDQRIEDSLDTEGMHMASTSEAIPQSNVGFQMLQKMGWKGQGLGSNEDGKLLTGRESRLVKLGFFTPYRSL